MIYPHLLYAVEMYGNAAYCNLNKLQVLQNKLLKILQMQGPRYPTNKLYINYKTLKIRDFHEQRLMILTHKIIHHPEELPRIYQNYLKLHNTIHNYDTRCHVNIYPHYIRTCMGAKDFRFKSHRLWNSLSEELKLTDSTLQFTCKIKQHYFSKYQHTT